MCEGYVNVSMTFNQKQKDIPFVFRIGKYVLVTRMLFFG